MENIGLGTAAIGRPLYINVRYEKSRADLSLPEFREKGIKMLDNAYNKGVRFFDTSPGYGLAESLLLEWMRQKNDRDITVATKWGLNYLANFDVNAKVHEVKERTMYWDERKLLPWQ